MSATFGQWLKARREERHLTLRDVEKITEGAVSNAALSQIETGKIKNPSLKVLHVLSAALGLDFADLCQRACVDNPPPPTPSFCPHCGQVIR